MRTGVTQAHTVLAGLVLFAFVAGCRCEGPTEPCVRGASIGARYNIQVEALYGPDREGDRELFPAYLNFSRYPSCGVNFDGVQEGAQLAATVRAIAPRVCSDGPNACRAITGTFEGAEVAFDGTSVASREEPFFQQSEKATVDESCSGSYAIGLEAISPEQLRRAGWAAPTDLMLFRMFSPDVSCAVFQEVEPCIDRWFVRVRDEDGHLVSTDYPVPADAGITDAATTGHDSGASADGGM